MKYTKFEEVPIWQKARKFVVQIYKITKNKFNNDFGLINQIQRATLSILLNISEGFERKSNKDFARFINQSKASCGECRAALYIASDLKYINKEEFDDLRNETIDISRQLAKFETYLIETHKK